MPSTWTLTVKSGLRVNVLADLDNPVTLTLLEIEDWQEPEWAFLRQLVQPGMRVLDADTGDGLYALSLAQSLQGRGTVLAQNTSPLFARSVADNGLQQVIQTSSHRPTSDQLAASKPPDEGAFDLIRLGAATTLDSRWLQQADPLILLPSDSKQLASLQAAGLGLYRLIPALGALVDLADGYRAIVNADHDANANVPATQEKPVMCFACSDTRAAWLREQGWLIRPT